MLQTNTQKTRSAFTLIELLVVIAIIAILAAILFPVFARARENARRSSCQSNLKQIGLGIIQYNQDYDEKFPLALYDNYQGAWPLTIQPYIKSVQVFQCPSDPDAGQPSPSTVVGGLPVGWAGRKISYGGNSLHENHLDGSGNNVYGFSGIFAKMGQTTGEQPRALADLESAATIVMVADKFSSDTTSLGGTNAPYGIASIWGTESVIGLAGNGTDLPRGNQTSTAYGPNTRMGLVSARHLETANFLYADGHVKSLRPELTNPDGNYYAWNGSRNYNNPKYQWSVYSGK